MNTLLNVIVKSYEFIIETIVEVFRNVGDFLKNHLVTFANIITVIIPYIMYVVGQYVANEGKGFSIGWELIIPLMALLTVYILKSIANKIGKGITIPVPNKRFTEVDEDGEVSMEVNRTQELLLYIADLEDWLERKGLL